MCIRDRIYSLLSYNLCSNYNTITPKELYTTPKSIQDINLLINDKLLAVADRLEKTIIKENALTALM